MDWTNSELNSTGLKVTNPAPQLIFDAPICWRATVLLRDSKGNDHAVATAIDPIRQRELFISGKPGERVPFRRLFRSTQNGWEFVQDEGLQHTALRMTESE